jgi:hypothetical protein
MLVDRFLQNLAQLREFDEVISILRAKLAAVCVLSS